LKHKFNYGLNTKKYILASNVTVVPSCKQCQALLPLDVSILFCPECGQSINLDAQARKQTKNLKMVNMKTQLLFTFIPFANLFAAYKLRKLRLSLARVIPDLWLLYLIIYSLVHVMSNDFRLTIFGIILLSVPWLMPSIVMFYFIRRWSAEQNSRLAFLESLQSQSD
jgi:hypothetical protein